MDPAIYQTPPSTPPRSDTRHAPALAQEGRPPNRKGPAPYRLRARSHGQPPEGRRGQEVDAETEGSEALQVQPEASSAVLF